MDMVTSQNVSDCLRVRYYFTLASCYFESGITKIMTETLKVLTYQVRFSTTCDY